MKNLFHSEFPNFLDHVSLSSKELCLIIENYDLKFSATKNNDVEWCIKFPVFLTPFYKYLYHSGTILTQEKFYDYYLSENQFFFQEKKFSTEIMEGLKARIFRTYPSLIRDLHFNILTKENIPDAIVIYNRKLDIEEGIDQLLYINNEYYAINLFTETSRARLGREKKEFRHTQFCNVKYIELPVNFKGSYKCGQFFLYGQHELQQIIKIINKI